jgi:hypothetical protein
VYISQIPGEILINPGSMYSESNVIMFPPGKSLVFFHNTGDEDFILRIAPYPQRDHLIPSRRAGILSLLSTAATAARLRISCPSGNCTGLAMAAFCSGSL